jgi:hypothetical protein
MFVHETDDRRSFANGRGDAFDRPLSHVAGSEDAGHARLERQGIRVMMMTLCEEAFLLRSLPAAESSVSADAHRVRGEDGFVWRV